MKAYELTTYEYDSYSYSGIGTHETFIHLSREGAEARAVDMKLQILSYCQNPDKHATIDEITIYP